MSFRANTALWTNTPWEKGDATIVNSMLLQEMKALAASTSQRKPAGNDSSSASAAKQRPPRGKPHASPAAPPAAQAQQTPRSTSPCHHFNGYGCSRVDPDCRFQHVCKQCGGAHSKRECANKGKNSGRGAASSSSPAPTQALTTKS
jgi:hypothetical protein